METKVSTVDKNTNKEKGILDKRTWKLGVNDISDENNSTCCC